MLSHYKVAGSYTTFRYKHGKKTPPAGRILHGPKLWALVDRTAEILNTWRVSRWEHEAACRHGLRQSFVLQGYRWALADAEAALIVSRALVQIGAGVRPTWAQGQPEFSAGPDYCRRCQRPLALPEAQTAVQRAGFCDELCLRAYHVSRPLLPNRSCPECGKEFQPSRKWAVYCSNTCSNRAHADLLPEIKCATCGKVFKPDKRSSKFCSHECYAASNRAREERACRQCGTRFFPRRPDQLWCSNTCRVMARKSLLPERPCAWCGAAFTPFSRTGKFCSTRCNARAQDAKRRKFQQALRAMKRDKT